MKGMTLDQYKEVIEFVQEHHKFAGYKSAEKRVAIKQIYPNINAHGFNIKYINSVYDSRTNTIWSITFRGVDVQFRTNMFVNLDNAPENFKKYDNLYDICMDYLKGEYKPEEDA